MDMLQNTALRLVGLRGSARLGSARLGSARLGSARKKFIKYKIWKSKSATWGAEVGLSSHMNSFFKEISKGGFCNPNQSVALPPFGTLWHGALPPTTPMQGSPTPATPWLGCAKKRGAEYGFIACFFSWHIFSPSLRCGEKEMPRYSGCAARNRQNLTFNYEHPFRILRTQSSGFTMSVRSLHMSNDLDSNGFLARWALTAGLSKSACMDANIQKREMFEFANHGKNLALACAPRGRARVTKIKGTGE
jgi:hypothetical protein